MPQPQPLQPTWPGQQPQFQPGFQAQPMPARRPGVPRGLPDVINPDWWFLARRRFSMAGVALSMMFAVWYGLAIIFGIIMAAVDRGVKIPYWETVLVSNGPLYFVAMPLTLLIFNMIPVLPTRKMGLKPTSFIMLLLSCFPIMSIGNIIGQILSALLSGGEATNSLDELLGADPVTIVVVTVILAPIFEEWIFRKQLIDHLRRYGEKPAIVFSALMFGLFHGNLYQFFYAFGIGLVLGYVYMRTSRLRYSIAMHMIVNLLGGAVPSILMMGLGDRASDQLSSMDPQQVQQAFQAHPVLSVSFLAFECCMVAVFFAGLVIMIVNRRKLVFFTTPEELPRSVVPQTIFLNVGSIIFMVLCLLVMVLALFN
ncbi:CPBP family intramembrane glutamic endopeptidase [Bifidobacterium aemilianum]|nr:type II CAAX endopeptidase family protein [Bifidobacterium aemilianum]